MTEQIKYEDEEIKDEQREIGEDIIKFLHLKKDSDGRIKTAWGTKTPLGLYLSLERIMEEGL